MEQFKSFDLIYQHGKNTSVKAWFTGFILLCFLILFLPWTQNIRTKGNITSLYQEQKPQKIYSPIAGKISYWKVKEGDFVQKGDTLVKIAEIKSEYLDPKLVQRTQDQLDAKIKSLSFYNQKVAATASQIENLRNAKKLEKELN